MSIKRFIHTNTIRTAFALSILLAIVSCKPANSELSPVASGQPAPSGQGRGKFATIPVQTTFANQGALEAEHLIAGVIQASTQSQVSAQTAGIVGRLRHQVGDWVEEGETIIKLDDTQLKMSLRIAQTALENARINLASNQDSTSQAGPKLTLQLEAVQHSYESAKKSYASAKALFDLGGISASDLDNAEAQVAQAEANLEAARTGLDLNKKAGKQNLAQFQLSIDQAEVQVQQAQLNLQFTEIKAPFAGQIAAINVSPGQYVGLNTAVFLLVSKQRQINFSLSPSDAARVPTGTAINFNVNGRDYKARISQAPSAPINGMVPIVARLAGETNLAYGSVGTVRFKSTINTGILIPISALQTAESQYFVFVVQGGKAIQRSITIVGQSGTTAVVAGIPPGSEIILNAPPGLLAGASVQPFKENADGKQAQQSGEPSPNRQKPENSGPQAPQGSKP